jgi:hypothetical protein
MVRRATLWRATGLIAVAWCLGCGEDPLDRASGPSMQPSARRAVDDGSANTPPRIESVRFEPAEPRSEESVRAVVVASDDDGDPLAFDYTWTVNDVHLTQRSGAIELGRVRKGDGVRVVVTCRDGRAESEPFEASTSVRNRAPQLSSLRFEPSSAAAGGTLAARPNAVDLDGDPISYSYTWWVNGSTTSATGAELSTEGMRQGDRIHARAVASDGEDESNAVDSPELSLGNAPPSIVSQPSGAGEDGVFRYQVRAEDPDGDRRLQISLMKGPQGMAMTATPGLLEWRPGPDQGGRHVIEVAAEDQEGGRSVQRFELEVDPGAASSGKAHTEAPPAGRDSDED